MQQPTRIILEDKLYAAEILAYQTIMGLRSCVGFIKLAHVVASLQFLRGILMFPATASLMVSVLRILFDLFEKERSLYVLMDQYLTFRRGILRRTNVIPIQRLQQILVRKPLLGHILDYGTRVVRAAGFSYAKVVRVPHPEKWQQAILNLQHLHYPL
jgi:membrane protein YdbS with pleckstrin-like domain